ncbi:glycoside hydrolase family 127 protein [Bacteroides propionicifaciens]|uniref:glycoside hydrolase family 127 protein n=1 Tax=Bacteroides propionicifaciens TaxID=392838 RepID=UPI0003A2E61E|nr:glycoside hydrolase family 127 protein [Bacteroides propionicifaciens]
MKKIIILISISLIATSLLGQSISPGQHAGKIKQLLSAPVKAYSFDLKDVRLLDSPFKENMERESKWILSIRVNSLLQSFRNTAGTFADLEGGYESVKKLGGWESLDSDLRGHTTGHIMSGLAYLYASTSDNRYKVKADSIVRGLADVQETLIQNGQKGYISAYPENLINRNIKGQSVWAPWYTLHKIYAGLLDQYLYCDNEQALNIVTKAAEWAYQKLMPLSQEQRTLMLRNEFGGVNEAFYNLYSITGDAKHKELAEFFYHAAVLDPLAEGNTDMYFKHANTFIPKLLGEARNYELHSHGRSKELATFFWNTVHDHQTFCTGGNSHKEKFIHTDSISKNLTGYTQETCNSYNMLKLTRHLFCWDTNPHYADYYERALYNHILGQQDPQSGMVAYFLPLLPGAHKVYSTPNDSFWCCVGTGFENHAKYGEAIYYNDGKGIFVNLFIPSELNWNDKGVKIRQETQFPNSEDVKLTLTVQKATKMPLYLRYPYWANDVEVKVNGKRIKIKQNPSSYVTLDRIWNDGDVVEVRYPMHFHLAEANDNADKAAIMYGPLVLAGAMGTEGMESPAPFSNPTIRNDYYTYDYKVPTNLQTALQLDRKNLVKSIERVDANQLVFKTINDNIKLLPIHNIHHQRYVVYWDLVK